MRAPEQPRVLLPALLLLLLVMLLLLLLVLPVQGVVPLLQMLMQKHLVWGLLHSRPASNSGQSVAAGDGHTRRGRSRAAKTCGVGVAAANTGCRTLLAPLQNGRKVPERAAPPLLAE